MRDISLVFLVTNERKVMNNEEQDFFTLPKSPRERDESISYYTFIALWSGLPQR